MKPKRESTATTAIIMTATTTIAIITITITKVAAAATAMEKREGAKRTGRQHEGAPQLQQQKSSEKNHQ